MADLLGGDLDSVIKNDIQINRESRRKFLRMAKMTQMLKEAESVFSVMLGLGLFGILFLVLYGNLSGNLGFAAGSQGENDTNDVINNLTGGAVTFFSFANVWFTLLAITVLIAIILGVITLVRSKDKGGSNFTS